MAPYASDGATDVSAPNITGVHCRYCGLSDPRSLVYCGGVRCKQWFCNGKTGDLKSSHIVVHGELSGHNEVAFFDENKWIRAAASTGVDSSLCRELGWVLKHCLRIPECYECGERNIFELGVSDRRRPWVARLIACRSCSVKYDKATRGQWNPFKTCHEKKFSCFASWACQIPTLLVIKTQANGWVPGESIGRSFLEDLENWTRKAENGFEKDFTTWREERVVPCSLAQLERTDYASHYITLVEAFRQMEIDCLECFDCGLSDLVVLWQPDSHYDSVVELPFGLHSNSIHPGQRITLMRALDDDDDDEPWSQAGSITHLHELPYGYRAVLHMFQAVPLEERVDGRGYSLRIEPNPIVFDRMLDALRKIESGDSEAMSSEIRRVLSDSFYGPLQPDATVVSKVEPDFNGNHPSNGQFPPRMGTLNRCNSVIDSLPPPPPALNPLASLHLHPQFGLALALTFHANGLQPLNSNWHYNHERPVYADEAYLARCKAVVADQLYRLQMLRYAQLYLQPAPVQHVYGRGAASNPFVPSVRMGIDQRRPNVVEWNATREAAAMAQRGTLMKVVQPPGLRPMNPFQRQAVSMVLENSVSLIQGPPGTGKTTTAAAVAFNLAVESFEMRKILCVAASNNAVDHLADQIGKTGISVARMYASSRDLPARSNLNFEIVPREKDAVHCHQIISVTCNCAGMACLKSLNFPYVIIDECTQAMEPDALVAITKGCKKLVLIGDQEQLGSVIIHQQLRGTSLAKSLFERLLEQPRIPKMMLQMQYRMAPSIREMINAVTYGKNGGLQDGIAPDDSLSYLWPKPESPMVFVHVPVKHEFSGAGAGRSLLNMGEAHFIARLVANIISWRPRELGISPEQVGIISFYNGQISHVRSQLAHHPGIGPDVALQVEVNSVDGFQGREKDVIILSCVRSGDMQKVRGFGFTDDKKRLNVALSRARAALIVVGNCELYAQSPIWQEYFKFIPIVRLGDIGDRMSIKCSCSSGGACIFCDYTAQDISYY